MRPLPVIDDNRRADIDGLRAVAVIAVVAFHAFPNTLPGGFVGVDVFFVISGYLISGIIFSALRNDRFSLAGFYTRRVRRIFPALIVVLIATLIAGYFVLLSAEFAALARQALAGSVFASNFLFWHEAGYFDSASELKPLLHLWSLAIEEQFYLVWPLLLWAAGRRQRWGGLVGGALVVSVSASIFLSLSDPVAGFYSPVSRFVGLGIGAALAWLSQGPVPPIERCCAWLARCALPIRPAILADVTSLVGLLLILGSVFGISRSSLFPGFIVLLPSVGAAAVLVAGPVALGNRRMLAHPLAANVGLVSYPLYLWHWPLLAFARTISFGEPSATVRLALVALALVLAVLTYLFLERPLRLTVPLKTAAITSLGTMVGVAALAALLAQRPPATRPALFARGAAIQHMTNETLLGWFPADPACIAQYGLTDEARSAKQALFCSTTPGAGPITVVLFGDSTANALFPGLSKIYEARGTRLLNVGNGTCAPFHGLVGHFDYNRRCADVNRKIYEHVLADPAIATVILSMAPWDIQNMDIDGLAQKADLAARFAAITPLVRKDLAALRAAGKRVAVTFDTPHIGLNPRACMTEPQRCTVSAATVQSRMEPYRGAWQALWRQLPEACVFMQDSLFRTSDGTYTATHAGLLLFRDDHHLSYFGSDVVAEAFRSSPCF